MYIQTTATNKLSKLTKRIRGISGGSSASKTISILLILIDYAQTNTNQLISIVSETMPHLRKGAMRDFENIMKEHCYWDQDRWNATNSIYTFETDTKIEFFPSDDQDKVRGPRRDILFVNEANNIGFETYTQLEIRTRKTIWLDWNPVSEFWFYTEVKPNEDVDFLILTYRDNEALEPAIIKSLEARRHNINWWKVYGEGLLGEAEGRIYKGWNLELTEIPHEARLSKYGLDFGYTNDPTALVAIYDWNGAKIFDELCYQRGMSNKDITDLIATQPQRLVIGDSSEPKSIDEIKSYGITIVGAKKGNGSILQGIQYVQDQQIFVTKRSINIIKEYRNYLWITDKDGKIINEPQDFMNHSMDAIRYGLESSIKGTFIMPTETGGIAGYIEGLL